MKHGIIIKWHHRQLRLRLSMHRRDSSPFHSLPLFSPESILEPLFIHIQVLCVSTFVFTLFFWTEHFCKRLSTRPVSLSVQFSDSDVSNHSKLLLVTDCATKYAIILFYLYISCPPELQYFNILHKLVSNLLHYLNLIVCFIITFLLMN